MSNAPLGGLDWNGMYAAQGGLIKEADEEAKGAGGDDFEGGRNPAEESSGGGLCSAYICSDERMVGAQFQQEKFDGGVKKFDDAAEVSGREGG